MSYRTNDVTFGYSVHYLNKRHCVEDLKKTMLCILSDTVKTDSGVEIIEEAQPEEDVAEEAVEEVAAAEETFNAEPVEEVANEGITLSETLDVAKHTVSHSAVNKN